MKGWVCSVGRYEQAWWANVTVDRPKRDRRSGPYDCYIPDGLAGVALRLDEVSDALVAEAERRVRALNSRSRDLAGISRFLLRSEAIASSRIEGIAPSARQVALAELGLTEAVAGVSQQAQLVARNMTLVRDATTWLARSERLAVDDIVALHHSLLPDEPVHHGLRTVQNWIGGSNWHPLDADFVPPPPEAVAPLMRDLVIYIAGGLHSPIAQAALVHAQFETIHPFTDGNGRVGRALIHTVLTRRGLTVDAVLPISLVLSTLRERYIEGLTRYRALGEADSSTGMAARAAWIALFAEVTIIACEQAERIDAELEQVRIEWTERLVQSRLARGATRALRSDSATAAILADLPATPVLTVGTVQRIHGVSHVAAGRALDELREAGILSPKSIGPGRRAYVSNDVLDLITWAERRMASTRFDTRLSPPRGSVPAVPQGYRVIPLPGSAETRDIDLDDNASLLEKLEGPHHSPD